MIYDVSRHPAQSAFRHSDSSRSQNDEVSSDFIGGNQQAMRRVLNPHNRLRTFPERRGKPAASLFKYAFGKRVSQVVNGRSLGTLSGRGSELRRREVERNLILGFREQSPSEVNRRDAIC